MHTAAWSFIALGTVSLTSHLIRQGILFENPMAIMVLPAGIGLLIGLRVQQIKTSSFGYRAHVPARERLSQ